MITDGFVSGTAERLTAILTELQQQPEVKTVVLCTADGLTVNGQTTNMGHISAVGGFLLSAAHLSSSILGHKHCQEVTVQLADNALLVCWPFMAAKTELILTVLFEGKPSYKRLLAQIVREIQQALEE